MQLPVITFIQTRLAEVDPNFDVREGTAHYDLFVIPQQFMLQPLNDFMTQRRVGQSVRQMLQDPAPDTPTTFSSTDADDAASNLYVTRDTGTISTGTVRVSYITPKDLEFPALTAQFTAGSLNFFNSSDFTLSASQMALQSDGSLFYADIPIQAEQAGDAYSVAAGSITAFLNDTDAVRVTNIAAMSAGLGAETNTALLSRTAKSIGVRDLETNKGINAILKQLFPFLQEIVAIGMLDPEMQRDIVYNVHVGGRTDVYLKTPNLTTGTTTIKGLITDGSRQVPISLHKMVARNITDSVYPPFTGTPSIVPGSEIVKEDVIETAASVATLAVPPAGIDLTNHQWLNIQIDNSAALQINISGATITATQKFEIMNTINGAFGKTVATAGAGNTIVITSPTRGAGSQVILNPLTIPIPGSRNASNVLFGILISSLPVTVAGIAAVVYQRDLDYIMDYINGDIYQATFDSTRDPLSTGRQTIVCGQTMIDLPAANISPTGSFTNVGSLSYLEDSSLNQFLQDPLIHVRAGDQVTINSINGITTGIVDGILIGSTFLVAQVVTTQRLLLSNFSPTASTSPNTVNYTIVSQQVVDISYKYNPISIDIGAQVLLADGITRGVRPGRDAFTIKDTPFVKIVSIQQVDSDTGELIGDPLNEPGGYGRGGFGSGGFGIGITGEYNFIVNDPPSRFSVFEDSMIIFNQNALSNSYIVTYLWDPQLQGIHSITRNDAERVTGADVLVKTFIPCFVDMTIGIRRDPTNSLTPTNDALTVLVQNKVNTTVADTGLKESDIIRILEDEGLSSVQTPFTMTGTILNPDGSTTVLTSQDIMTVPSETLPSQTNNFTTARITHFFPNNISCVEVP